MTRGHDGRSSSRADYLARPVVHVDIRNIGNSRGGRREIINGKAHSIDPLVQPWYCYYSVIFLVELLGSVSRTRVHS